MQVCRGGDERYDTTSERGDFPHYVLGGRRGRIPRTQFSRRTLQKPYVYLLLENDFTNITCSPQVPTDAADSYGHVYRPAPNSR
jgi:hypothetical protein